MTEPERCGYASYPNVERHRLAWLALGRALLPLDLCPSRAYRDRLVHLQARFLGTNAPTLEEFGDVVRECLGELRDAHYPSGVAVTGDQAAALQRAKLHATG